MATTEGPDYKLVLIEADMVISVLGLAVKKAALDIAVVSAKVKAAMGEGSSTNPPPAPLSEELIYALQAGQRYRMMLDRANALASRDARDCTPRMFCGVESNYAWERAAFLTACKLYLGYVADLLPRIERFVAVGEGHDPIEGEQN